MKRVLLISLVLNLAFAGYLVCLLIKPAVPESNSTTSTVGTVEHAGLPLEPLVESKPATSSPTAYTFHWRQLESEKDYRIYVANLRACGCPEETVEDIVRGDVDRVFYAKRRELNVNGSQPGPWSSQAQSQLLADMLGQKTSVDDSKSTAVSEAPRTVTGSPPAYPLVLQQVDLNALGFDEQQQQRIAQIREEFIQNIGGMKQDPSDPAYLARWIKAQHEADSALKGWLGSQAAMKYSMALAGANNQ